MSDLIARLIDAGTPSALVAEVANELARVNAELQVLERRRQNERERKARSRDVTGHNVTARESRDKGFPEVSPHTPLPNPSQISVSPRVREGWPEDYREQFWRHYPHKVGKTDALKKLDGVMRSGKIAFDPMMAALDRYIATKPADRPWCNPSTWLTQGRWEDQPAGPSAVTTTPLASEQTTVWVTDDDPRWPRVAERYVREKGRNPPTKGLNGKNGLGWYFPKDWVEAA